LLQRRKRILSGKLEFAADAGIQDAVWHIKYGYLGSLPVSPVYNQFDFSSAWNYGLSQQVNKKDVNITIQNVWVPSNITVPSQPAAAASKLQKIIGKLIRRRHREVLPRQNSGRQIRFSYQ